jgi:glutamate racemase
MEPAVKPAVEGTEGRRVMVIATPVTIREAKLKDLLHRVDAGHRVDLLAMPRLVEFAEREEFESDIVRRYIEEQFSQYDKSQYCALVLGCTHFNYFKPCYREYFGRETLLVDGNGGTIRHLAEVLGLNVNHDPNILWSDTARYFFSGKEITDEDTLKYLKRLHLRLEEVRNI